MGDKKLKKFWKYKIAPPLKIINMEGSLFAIWLILVLFGSLLGVLFTYLVTTDWCLNTLDILNQGSFYLISISFATAIIADLFSSLILDKKEYATSDKKNDDILFFEHKILTIVAYIFLIAVMANGYAAHLNDETPPFTKYFLQIFSYMLTIVLGIYSFGLKYSFLHEEDMIAAIDEEVEQMQQANKSKDSKGRQLI